MSAPGQRPPQASRPDASPPARDLDTVLAEAEGVLAARSRDRCGRATPQAAEVAPARLRHLTRELERLLAEDPVGAADAGGRLDDVRARLALHTRDVPDGALAGLYEDIRVATRDTDAWARARMSEAFLDAPQHLVRWRRAAMAACTVLAIGAGLMAGGRLGFHAEREADFGSADPRDGILERFDEDSSAAPWRRPAAGTFVSLPGASAPAAARASQPAGDPPSFWVFHLDGRRPASAARFLDAVRGRAPPPSAEQVEHN